MTQPIEPTDPEEPEQPPRQEIVPQFTPVPRQCDRSNGWKPEVQRQFIEALAETGSVRAACKRVGRADHGAYLLRRHPDAHEFRRAWDAALDIGIRRIEDVAMDRAINGVQQPLHYHGEIFGERTVYNDRLLMFMLRNRAPERFGGGLSKHGGARGENAIDQMTLARLKKRWRREWAAEQVKEEQEDVRAIYTSIDDKLSTMRKNWLQSMSPRVRALYRAYEEAEREEREGRRPEGLPLLPGVPWPTTDPREIDEAEWEELDELENKGIEPR
jgi:hypothetical protein